MSSTSLVQSNSTNSLSRSTNSQSNSQSPATKAKNVIAHPIAALTPQKGPFSPSGANNASPAVSTPGRWQHPRMEEIVRRQNSSCFNPGDSRIVVLNAAAIVFTFLAQPYLSSYVPMAVKTNSSELTTSQHPHIDDPQHTIRELHHLHHPTPPFDQHSFHPLTSLPPTRHLRGHPPHTTTEARLWSTSHEPTSNTTRRSTIRNTTPLLPQCHTSLLLWLGW